MFTYDAQPQEGALPDGSLVGYSCVVMFNNRPVIGYVVDEVEHLEQAPTFEIHRVECYLDGPYFDASVPHLAQWICCEYGSTLAESLRLFLPPAGKRSLARAEDGSYTVKDDGPRPLFRSWYSLTDAGQRAQLSSRARKQAALKELLSEGERSREELVEALGSNITATLKVFLEAGWVTERRVRVYRGDIAYDARSYERPSGLNNEQQAATTALASALRDESSHIFVLDGVTGSGKTEVYLRVIEEAVRMGRGALVLVPEISLTPQTVGRFQARFPGRVAVLHSRLTEVERQDQWERIARGDTDVVVGARSALFAPLANVGLVVIDEEHDGSYKQGSSPRYHARDVAAQLCAIKGIPLVLGSATPSFEALYRCEQGEWERLELPTRANGAPLPSVEVVDLTKEFKDGNTTMFSRRLQCSLQRVQEKREKAILLLNRRGSASFLLCRDCGFVPTCPDCSVSLTYHESDHHLHCHQCNRILPVPGACPECGSPYLAQFKAGTQRLESALRALFPDLAIVRMDADTTRTRGGHQQVLDEFNALDSGVLIGTQMIAKGHDFPEVTLVGVISADTILNLPDFTAGERTYQLLEQVAGRAGRGELAGEVIVQTYWPDHPAIQAAALHNRQLFYEQEVQTRKALGYPPFERLANVIVSSTDPSEAHDYASMLAEKTRDLFAQGEVLGPAPSVIARVMKRYRFHFLVKAQRNEPLGALLSDVVARTKKPQSVSVAIDVDPLSLM